jgi:hypothetical protein
MEEPRKVNPEAVEVIGAHGEVVKEAKEHPHAQTERSPFGQVRVFQGGPWLLLLIPVVLPLLLVALFFMSILALFFGRSVFQIASKGMRKQ